MVVMGMFGKFGALFVTIPNPIIGGVFIVMFGTSDSQKTYKSKQSEHRLQYILEHLAL